MKIVQKVFDEFISSEDQVFFFFIKNRSDYFGYLIDPDITMHNYTLFYIESYTAICDPKYNCT